MKCGIFDFSNSALIYLCEFLTVVYHFWLVVYDALSDCLNLLLRKKNKRNEKLNAVVTSNVDEVRDKIIVADFTIELRRFSDVNVMTRGWNRISRCNLLIFNRSKIGLRIVIVRRERPSRSDSGNNYRRTDNSRLNISNNPFKSNGLMVCYMPIKFGSKDKRVE